MPLDLSGISDTDLKRFALCYLCSDRSNVNWDAAAAAYDPNVQVASFKTVTSKATTKALKAAEGDVAATPKKAAGGKRKKAPAAEDDEGEAPTPKKKRGRPPKKAASKSEEKVESEGEQDAADGLIKDEGDEI